MEGSGRDFISGRAKDSSSSESIANSWMKNAVDAANLNDDDFMMFPNLMTNKRASWASASAMSIGTATPGNSMQNVLSVLAEEDDEESAWRINSSRKTPGVAARGPNPRPLPSADAVGVATTVANSDEAWIRKRCIACRRVECPEGILTNIGFPRKATRSLELAKERGRTFAERPLPVTHGVCFTCSVCGDKPKRKSAWQRYCLICNTVYSNNGFFSQHGGNMGRGDERQIQHRIPIHKQHLWEMYVKLVKCGNESLKNRIVLGFSDLPADQRWLQASLCLKSPHRSMSEAVATMTTTWIDAHMPELPKVPAESDITMTSAPVTMSTGVPPMPPPSDPDTARFSCGRNFLSASDASDIRSFVAQQRKNDPLSGTNEMTTNPITLPVGVYRDTLPSSDSTLASKMSDASSSSGRLSRHLPLSIDSGSRERNLLQDAGSLRDSMRFSAADLDSVFSSMSDMLINDSRPDSLRLDSPGV